MKKVAEKDAEVGLQAAPQGRSSTAFGGSKLFLLVALVAIILVTVAVVGGLAAVGKLDGGASSDGAGSADENSSTTLAPTFAPSSTPSLLPTHLPTLEPIMAPSTSPSVEPTFAPTQSCGNSQQDGGEECDDGNEIDLDGCSSNCEIESFFNCPQVGLCTPTLSSVTLSDLAPRESSTLSVTLGASPTGTFTYYWYVNDQQVAGGPLLNGTYFDKGDTIYAVVTVTSIANVTSSDRYSAPAICVNTGPVMQDFPMILESATPEKYLCNFTEATDADNDDIEYSVEFLESGGATSSTGILLDETLFESSDAFPGSTLADMSCQVTFSDGDVQGVITSSG